LASRGKIRQPPYLCGYPTPGMPKLPGHELSALSNQRSTTMRIGTLAAQEEDCDRWNCPAQPRPTHLVPRRPQADSGRRFLPFHRFARPWQLLPVRLRADTIGNSTPIERFTRNTKLSTLIPSPASTPSSTTEYEPSATPDPIPADCVIHAVG
jgi:hypothetical protein